MTTSIARILAVSYCTVLPTRLLDTAVKVIHSYLVMFRGICQWCCIYMLYGATFVLPTISQSYCKLSEIIFTVTGTYFKYYYISGNPIMIYWQWWVSMWILFTFHIYFFPECCWHKEVEECWDLYSEGNYMPSMNVHWRYCDVIIVMLLHLPPCTTHTYLSTYESRQTLHHSNVYSKSPYRIHYDYFISS